MIISSYVIEAIPDRCAEVSKAVCAFPGVEVHGQEESRLIVTIEADCLSETQVLAAALSRIEDVTTVKLIYCNFEDETLCD